MASANEVVALREEVYLSLPKGLVRKVSVIAAERDTNLSVLVEEFLQGLVDRDYVSVVRTITRNGMRSDPPPGKGIL